MDSTTLRVPDALLLHPDLGKSAKLLWIVLQKVSGDAASVPATGLLQARSGLARHTVLRALAQLRAQGWLPQGPDRGCAAAEAEADAAHIPEDLLPDRHLSVQAKLLYASLQRIAGGHHPRGECTYAQLCQQAGVSLNTAKRAVRALQSTGWLQLSQRNKFSPIHFLLCNPVARRRDEAVARTVRRLNAAPYRGEALMRAYLSLLVDSDEHDDDASPAFLVNPFTGEEMQFDRYYTAGVAFEFHGARHYGPTDHYADEIQVLKQQARDYMKQQICAARGIHLAVVHPEDLTLARMRQKVKEHLPLRDARRPRSSGRLSGKYEPCLSPPGPGGPIARRRLSRADEPIPVIDITAGCIIHSERQTPALSGTESRCYTVNIAYSGLQPATRHAPARFCNVPEAGRRVLSTVRALDSGPQIAVGAQRAAV